MRNILVTNYLNSNEDVMIFSNVQTEQSVKAKLDSLGQEYEEIYEVEEDQLRFYCYDPCHLKD